METETLQSVVSTNQWGALLPEIILGCFAVLILFVDLLAPRTRPHLSSLSILAQLIAGAVLILGMQANASRDGAEVLFAGLIAQESTADWMRLFFLLSSIIITHLGSVFLKKQKLAHVEFYHLVLIVSAAFMLLVQTHHFISLFVVLETLTVGFYILVAYKRDSRLSLEAGLKYLIMAAFSSGIFLFGVALLYGAASNPALPMTATSPLNFSELTAFISASNDLFNNSTNYMVLFGSVLVLTGIAFKIGVVPFQIWIPDVYQGAPTPVTAFLAVSSKAAGFYLLYLLLRGPFAALEHVTVPLLTVIAILTLLFGNIAALGQRNVKRVMGMSGVAHAGILLMGLLASLTVDWAFAAVLFYLVTYALASFGVFEVMVHVAESNDADQDLDLYDNLLKKDPYLGGILLISLGSLAGIPPLAGFIAKLLVFIAAFQAGLYPVLGVALAGVVISIYYYFGWMRSAAMGNPYLAEDAAKAITSPALSARLVMGLLAGATILFGFYQGFFAF
ncbi:NADH-quinone oxidoreductase subunit N [Puniceicoccales bacterium CK1056]|uniref:NADH-quinone oxidoreductase subunit N n=1 Tax=Oceanipulchritudo coccoides TaxID=2706888 RepID=A0A6B2M3N3_9BACT|nr:NADH-quinone oxidoreductase subunit N [Oceanipulchritudo coccoides]NDV62425.1 NADH-quinone oxidoreductase subunit N [Oceanipulchritudo coccoides]